MKRGIRVQKSSLRRIFTTKAVDGPHLQNLGFSRIQIATRACTFLI